MDAQPYTADELSYLRAHRGATQEVEDRLLATIAASDARIATLEAALADQWAQVLRAIEARDDRWEALLAAGEHLALLLAAGAPWHGPNAQEALAQWRTARAAVRSRAEVLQEPST